MTSDEQKTVRAARADKEKTNKRRCEPHGQLKKRRTKDEQKTVRAARADER